MVGDKREITESISKRLFCLNSINNIGNNKYRCLIHGEYCYYNQCKFTTFRTVKSKKIIIAIFYIGRPND